MKSLLLIAACALVTVSGAPSSPVAPEVASRRALPALYHEEVHDAFGQYALRYVTDEGTIVSVRGRLVPGAEGYVMVYEGETTHIGPDGKVYVTKYSAGIDGVKVEGDHLPKAPEVPEIPVAIA